MVVWVGFIVVEAVVCPKEGGKSEKRREKTFAFPRLTTLNILQPFRIGTTSFELLV